MKDFICWIVQSPESSRVVINANNRKEAIKKFAESLGVGVSGYLKARERKSIEINIYEIRVS